MGKGIFLVKSVGEYCISGKAQLDGTPIGAVEVEDADCIFLGVLDRKRSILSCLINAHDIQYSDLLVLRCYLP